MKDSLRRPILFAVIVITGSFLILFDIPLIILIPVLLIVGFAILIILGAITIAEIKSSLNTLKLSNLKKKGIIKRLDEMKFFEKPAPGQKGKIPPEKPTIKPAVKPDIKQPVKSLAAKSSISLHLTSFITSLKSLGTVLKARSKSGKKVDEINKQLDKTVIEKVEKSSALTSAGSGAGTSAPFPPPGGAGAATGTTPDQDPFLSLSEDEFDAGLLDSLNDLDSPGSTPGSMGTTSAPLPDTNPLDISEPDIPLPSLDIDGETGDILRDNAQGLEEFSGLDGGEAIDDDFGDLDSLSLDDVELDDETGNNLPPATTPAESSPVSTAKVSDSGKDAVKTAWIKSDAPKDAGQTEDPVSTQSDMAAFSGGSAGTDADLLSSLASDVKHITKEKDLSLLRELKDFKAPATEIENELSDMYTRMSSIQKDEKNKKTSASGNGINQSTAHK